MPYRICKSIELESGHLLSKHPGNCKFPHGHTRAVEIIFTADSLDDNDMVMDFKVVKEMLGEFLEQFDHSLCMN
ncbi:MAG: 6-carboxytetrahydropterin synthase, partial [Akkermansia sp.]